MATLRANESKYIEVFSPLGPGRILRRSLADRERRRVEIFGREFKRRLGVLGHAGASDLFVDELIESVKNLLEHFIFRGLFCFESREDDVVPPTTDAEMIEIALAIQNARRSSHSRNAKKAAPARARRST